MYRNGDNDIQAGLRIRFYERPPHPCFPQVCTGKSHLIDIGTRLEPLIKPSDHLAGDVVRFGTVDQVSAEVKDAASALRTAHNRAQLATQEVQVALELADAERVRFDLGDSTLFTVNLRELAAVEAELREISAINDFLRALTVYERATAGMLRNP